jgi:hypothetical protein
MNLAKKKFQEKKVYGVKNHFAFTNLLRNLNLESQLTDNKAIRSAYVRSSFHLREETDA